MKRSLANLVAAAAASALVLVGAPAAHAQDCTTVYLDSVTNPALPEFVTYEPPANVGVNGNAVIGVAARVVGATITYVDCVV